MTVADGDKNCRIVCKRGPEQYKKIEGIVDVYCRLMVGFQSRGD